MTNYNELEKAADEMGIEVGFMKLSDSALIPVKYHMNDSGFDLFSDEDVQVASGETLVIDTNIATVLPSGYEAQIRPRSGITAKTKLRVQLGTIDNTYRGNLGIIVDNISINKEPIRIWKGMKIAQLIVQQLPRTVGVEVFHLNDTDRGSNGFGSTGV